MVGPKGRHLSERTAVRHGSELGQVTLGGRWVRVRRPRVRTADGSREVALPTYQAFAATDLLDQVAVERMLAKPQPLAAGGRSGQHGEGWDATWSRC